MKDTLASIAESEAQLKAKMKIPQEEDYGPALMSRRKVRKSAGVEKSEQPKKATKTI
jgi:hypothetical protein